MDDDVNGPRAGSAANAVKHGLSAQKFFPAELAKAVDEYRSAFFTELAPRGVLQEFLVTELARHAAAIQVAADGEHAALRAAEQNTGALRAVTNVAAGD